MSQSTPPLPDQMQAVQIVEHNEPYQLRTVPVAAASYCHTDGMVAQGVFGTQLPVTASHEGSGTVVRVGGDASGFRQYCPRTEGHVGVHRDGCLAEYVRVDARFTTKLPAGVSLLDAAPLACAGRTVWRAVQQTNLQKGQWLALVGSGGGLGHLGIQFATKALGLRVLAIDARDGALDLSRELGAEAVLDARLGKREVVESRRGGHGADATVVLADSPGAAGLGCAVTRMHGTVVQVAQPEEVRVPFAELVFRDIRVRGSLLCSPGESRDMLEAVAAHGVEVRMNVFHGLESIGELMEMVEGGRIQGKAVVVVDQGQIDAEG
ncbi:hypothetical protein PG991_010595 [Apiospora marii]|uniref:Enoyl reductase (ER) domain-containing protein n=1 Tax=Apiospora marii TaxID=335849 RepID=A0ABR1RCP7_9PEZI